MSSSKFMVSWQLLRSSFRVMRENPRLLWFPVISLTATLVLLALFLAPVVAALVFHPTGHAWTEPGHWKVLLAQLRSITHGAPGSGFWSTRAGLYSFFFVVYLVSHFFATFFNVAFYHEVIKAFNGEIVSLRNGFRFAVSRMRAIAMWSLLAATIGMLIRSLEERFGWFGRLAFSFIGMAWSAATVFVVPVIIRENNLNPIDMLRDSARILRQAWGESLVGYVGLRLGGTIALLCTIGLAISCAFVSVGLHQHAFIVPLAVSWVTVLVISSFVISVAGDIYRCALYIYASEGVVPEPFDAEMMNAAWKVKS
jgi:hypothetical protein